MPIESPETAVKEPEFRSPTAGDHMSARRMYIHGEGSIPQIAKKLGISHYTCNNWLRDEGWYQLRQEYEKRELERIMGPKEPEPQSKPAAIDLDAKDAQIDRIAKRMTSLEETMDGCTDARELAALAQAHSSLFRTWCVLTGTQSPGTRRPSRRSQPMETGDPLTPSPQAP